MNAPLSRRTTILANYTLAKTRDNDSSDGPYAPVTAVYPLNLLAERGPSSFDQRQTFNVNS